MVIDPDSRLTQLGLLPVCPKRTATICSRAAPTAPKRASPLPELAAAWAAETFGVAAPRGRTLHAPRALAAAPYIAVSLGVGENPAKRIPDPFEEELLRLLAATGLAISIDQGAGGEEAERVARARGAVRRQATVWDGSFAGFAQIIAAARLYVGYDSAGQHVAAASGVPLISVFAGFPCARMFDRWRPAGAHSAVIRADSRDPQECLARVKEALGAMIDPP